MTIQVTNKETGEVFNYTEEQYEATRTLLLLEWDKQKKALEAAKESEMAARKAVVAFAFDTDKAGTQTVQLGSGYAAKAVIKINYGWRKGDDGKIDKSAIEKALAKIEKDGSAGELIAERLVKWTPELSLTEYKLLSDKHRKAIDDVIVTTEGAPTLDIVEPKAKK